MHAACPLRDLGWAELGGLKWANGGRSPLASVYLRAFLVPALEQVTLAGGDLRGVIERHQLEHHGLLVQALGVTLDVGRRVQGDALALQLGRVAHGATLVDHALDLGEGDAAGGSGSRGGAVGRGRDGRACLDRSDRFRLRYQPHDQCQQHQYTGTGVFPRYPLAVHQRLVAGHEAVADQRADQHHQHQHDPVVLTGVQPAVVIRQHGDQHRQGEVGVVHAALLGAPAVDRVDRLAGLQLGHHLALARDDPDEDVGAHRRGQHGAYQQEGGAAGEQLAGQPGGEDDEAEDDDADDQVTVLLAAEGAADDVVDQPEHDEEGQRTADGGAGGPVMHALVDHEGAGVEQVQHREQAETGQPRGVALPVEPVQVVRHGLRGDQVFLRVVEAAAVHGPQFAVHALGDQVGRRGFVQAVVEEDKVERCADPGDRRNYVGPPQQQVDPVKQVHFHRASNI